MVRNLYGTRKFLYSNKIYMARNLYGKFYTVTKFIWHEIYMVNFYTVTKFIWSIFKRSIFILTLVIQ